MTYIIVTEDCKKDTACVDVCPVDCIYGAREDGPQLYIHPEECIDCGLCVDACPNYAIFPMEEVPDGKLNSIGVNYRHFDLDPPDY